MKKSNRILSHEEFTEIIKKTPFVKSQSFVVHYRKNSSGYSRIGIAVGKKNGNAVTRNLVKRQIRAIIAKSFDLSKPIDLIIMARASYNPDTFHDNESELLSCYTKIGEHK